MTGTLGTGATSLRSGPRKLRLVTPEDKPEPTAAFVRLTRNPALRPPVRFEPTVKRPGDIVI